jgi:penicillin amidase
VVGATIPGIPIVVLGHTARVAWGFTNAMVDDVDFVVEELSVDSTRYRTARGWAAVQAIAETVAVRGARPVVRARRRTEHGPLVSSRWRPDSNRALALRWTAQDPGSDELLALLGFARARDWREFGAALASFGTPQQNVVFADSAGQIAYWLAGRVPVRAGGAVAMTPLPAWEGRRRWVRYLGASELPHVLDPGAGWIATANNPMAGAGYPHFISRHYDLGYRAARIATLLRADTNATTASVSSHQMDVVDQFARAHRSLAAGAALAAGRADLADRLRAWDGGMRADAVEPAVFWAWYRELQRLTFDDESPAYQPAEALHRWMATGESAWFDDARTPERETLDTLARRAMAHVLRDRRLAPWGDVHATVMDHPLAAIPLLGRWLGFQVGPLRAGGSNHTVNNASSFARRPPFTSDYGPSLRHVVDLGDVDGAGGFILPTGQSGHPLSRHYRDQTERWLRGDLWVLPVDGGRVLAVDTLVLTP